jgi:fructose/tagatose bisphosphate aldolase
MTEVESGESSEVDILIEQAVFGSDEVKQQSRQKIREIAREHGIFPASIDGLYQARSKGLYNSITVPAINIRGITYQVARTVFSSALKSWAGAFIFEIARSEIGYTAQRPDEYAVCILAAAIKEGFKGPVFIQGDHFQVNHQQYNLTPAHELLSIKELIREAVNAGFYNIDIDASTVVDIEKSDMVEQQRENYRITAEMTRFIRNIAPEGITISIGGEIGEVGGRNSTVADLKAFMSGYLKQINPGMRGLSKISVQTGTRHGGVVLPDGTIATVNLDFEVLRELSKLAREEYGMGGAVQHGASTLPDEAFDIFPQKETVEVHLATGFQNIIMDSPYFPFNLKGRIHQHLLDKYARERNPEETEEQFIYKTRKKAFGDFKEELWRLPEETMKEIRNELEERFTLLFNKLKVANTLALVNKYVVNRH